MKYTRAVFYLVLLFLIKEIAIGKTHFDEIPTDDQGMRTGPEIGSIIPKFLLADQYGKMRDFASITGPKGALILFYRSANW